MAVNGRDRIWRYFEDLVMGAIIPALAHRIPKEIRGSACLGESSTRMGDPLGSPRVAPLFLFFGAFPVLNGICPLNFHASLLLFFP